MEYAVKKGFSDNLNLVTTISDKAVGLNAEIMFEEPGDKDGPPKVRIIPKATQAELKALFESGNPLIELLENIEQFEAEPKPRKAEKIKQDAELH